MFSPSQLQSTPTFGALEKPREDPLEWGNGEQDRPIIEVVGPGHWLNQRRFSSALERAGILDVKAVDIPGGVVLLPHGNRLARRFRMLIREAFEGSGLEEYDYPNVAPVHIFSTLKSFLGLEGKLLYLGVSSPNEKPMGVMCPSGEAIIYEHWRKKIRNRSDLPVKMFRCARYYRPTGSGKRAGKGIFKSLEAGDVFEFHCAYASEKNALPDFDVFLHMMREVCACLRLPMLWTTRPPWTNNNVVSEQTIGGDVVLPVGNTVQGGCLYRQGRRFSRPIGIGFTEGGIRRETYHLTGALTRRLLLSHLMLGMFESGAVYVHPHLAPIQVGFVYFPAQTTEHHEAKRLEAELIQQGVRVSSVAAESKSQAAREEKRLRREGCPLVVFIRGPRNDRDVFKIGLFRADTRQTVGLGLASLHKLSGLLLAPLHNVGITYDSRVSTYMNRQVLFLATKGDLKNELAARRVIVCPMETVEEHVRRVATWRLGEVLGFVSAAEPAACVFTGSPVRTRAVISPRL